MIIAIDFDGTCVMHEYPKIGEDIGAVPVLKELVNTGHQLILWTMRSDSHDFKGLTDAVNWFNQNNIPLYGIQCNPTQSDWTQSPKAYAQLYIDDAALGAPLTTKNCPNFIKNDALCKKDCELCRGKSYIGRPFLNWKKAKQILIQDGILPKENKKTKKMKPKFYGRFYKNYKFMFLPFYKNQKLLWKDKFNSPRTEILPSITIEWLWFGYRGQWGCDQYWEQWLWIHKYCHGNIETAKKEWGRIDMETKKSTWIDF